MNNLYETINYRGYMVSVFYDEDPQNPRDDNGLGTIYTAQKRGIYEEDFFEHFSSEEVFDGHFGVFKKSFLKEYIALPIYMYDHLGLLFNTTGFSCPWDTSQLGIIAVSVDKIKKEFKWKNITSKRREQIENYLKSDIQVYEDFVNGNVYRYEIVDKEGKEVDSCGGYYGDSGIQYIKEGTEKFIKSYILNSYKEKIKKKLENIRKYGLQLSIPFQEFPELCLSKLQIH